MQVWKPSEGQQEKFHRSAAFEVLYGGQAGGGKTESLLVEALRYAAVPGYNAIIFRRTFPELQQPEGLIERSRRLCPPLGGVYHETKLQWRFPAGALLIFRHMERVVDRLKHQSAEYAYIGFDELTTFTEQQYRYLFSRARTTCGVEPRIRAGTNPGGIGHEWVKRRWAPWLDTRWPESAGDGELKWFKQEGESDVACDRSDPDGLSRTFIRSSVWDNPHLMTKDPEYITRLKALPLVERLQLLEGDWDILPAAGNVFKREWFKIAKAKPGRGVTRARFWDLAATAKEIGKADPDRTAGAKVSRRRGEYFVEQIIKRQTTWGSVKRLIAQTAKLDGKGIPIGVEQEPGASGKAVINELASMREISGKFNLRGIVARTDKLKRANFWSAQAEAGNVYLVDDGTWDVESFLLECEMFPEGTHDDQVDAVSGAITMLGREVSIG